MTKEKVNIKTIILFSVLIHIFFILLQAFRISELDYIQISQEVDLNILKPIMVSIVAMPLIALFFNIVPAWFIFEIVFHIQIPRFLIIFRSIKTINN